MKKSFSRITTHLLLLIVFSILLTGCRSDPLRGKWEEPNSGVTIEIRKGGTLVMGLNGVTATMTYELRDPDIFIIKANADAGLPEQKMTYKVEEDTLTLTTGGINTVFRRVK